MAQVMAITEQGELTRSLERFFHITRGVSIRGRRVPRPSPDRVADTFRQLADWIESGARKEGGESGLRNALVFVDLSEIDARQPENLNPLAPDGSPWVAVVGMLVLAFPEVHWVFIHPDAPSEPDPSSVRAAHDLLGSPSSSRSADISLYERAHVLGPTNSLSEIVEFHEAQFIPLFDPTNLRNTIREGMKSCQDGKAAPYLPLRRELAAAIDEEEPYAYLHAYTAYLFGLRSHTICSYRMFDLLFGKSDVLRREHISLLFEDLYLNFADRAPDVHLSNLRDRDETWLPRLHEANRRVFVRIGHAHPGDRDTRLANKAYIEELRARGTEITMLDKPISGIFDLWQRSGLSQWIARHPGSAYVWPPDDSQIHELKRAHSAPGRLLMVAERMIQRAERVRRDAQTVPEALHAALLCMEAQEYLGHRTPTTSLEALALKHQCEALAECMFYGVDYNIDVDHRLREIDRDMESIVAWFGPRTQKSSLLSAEIGIVGELTLTFRNHGQFDEEQKCLARGRKLYRQLWRVRNRKWAWLFYPLRAYTEYLLGGIARFVAAILVWILVLSLLFDRYCPHPDILYRGAENWSPVLLGLDHAVVAFFGTQPPHDVATMAAQGAPALFVSILAIIAGFVHLGIFVSYLYTAIARR